MKIVDVIRRKGDAPVVTVAPDDTVRSLLGVLAEHGIGAAVVSADGRSLDGIVSERDVVRALQTDGAAVLSSPVSQIMTADVRTCARDVELHDIAVLMTRHRIRHLPVVEDGELVSLVSIGDVVKQRLDELQAERDQLVDYIQQ